MFLLVDYGKVFCSLANAAPTKLKCFFHEFGLFCTRFIAFTFHLCDRLSVVCMSFVNNSSNSLTNTSTSQSSRPDSGKILCHQYGFLSLRRRRPSQRSVSASGRRNQRPHLIVLSLNDLTLVYRKGTTGKVTLSGSDYPLVSDS